MSEISVSNTAIPKIIHFIYFGYTEFTFIHYFAIKTAHDNNPTYKIYLYNYTEPTNNIWWTLTKNYVEIIYTEPPEEIFNNKLNNFAHKADIIRLKKLIEHGGIYLDIDIWTMKSYDNLLDTSKSCIMGYQASNTQFEGLCNAVIIAKPQSNFLKIWLENYKNFNNTEWDKHSVYLPLELSKKYSELIEIKSQEAFFPVSWWEFEDLFKKDNTTQLTNSYCIHLWESHLMENLLQKINPTYFYIFNTPIVNIFKQYVVNKNKPNILCILDNNCNLSKSKQLLYNLLSQGYNINLIYINDLLSENNSIISNNTIINITDDMDLCINNLYANTALSTIIDNVDCIVTNTLPNKWVYIKYKFKKLPIVSIKDYNIKNIDLDTLNIVDNFIVEEKKQIETNNIKELFLPFMTIPNYILCKPKYNSILYEQLDKSFKCTYSDNIIKINNIFIENYKCMPLTNVKNDKFIFYTKCTLDENIFNIIDSYYGLCKQYSDNILLYIIGVYNSSTIKLLETIINKYSKYSILFNFNNLSTLQLETIHTKTHCYIDIDDTNIKYDAILHKTPVILLYNNMFLENTYKVNVIQDNYDPSHLSYLMNLIYSTKDPTKTPIDVLYNKMKESYVKSSILLDDLLSKFSNKENQIIKENSKDFKKDTKKEISQIREIQPEIREVLIMGKHNIFKNRMDTSYYDLLQHLTTYSEFVFTFVDTTLCEKNKPMQYYIDTYCKTTNPILYHIIYINKDEQIVSDIADCKLTKIYEIEDCYEVDNIISNINMCKYDYVMYRYNCEQMNYIMSNCESKFIHYSHYIDTGLFNIRNTNKTIDILLYGNTSNFYPFRYRLFELIKKSGLNYYYLPHPGYDTTTNITTKKTLSELINKAKITISTCSSFNYFLKKYIEISLSGSIIAGNFPKTENENVYENTMCLLEETYTDELIIHKLKNILSLSSEEYNNIVKKSYEISMENYTYTQGLEKFDKIFNYIYNLQENNTNNVNNTINNNTVNNDIFSKIYDNNIWNMGKGGSGEGSSIEYNKNTYIPFMRQFIEKNNIKKIVDLGAGDWQSSYLIYENLNIDYYGYDVYEKFVNENKKKYPQYNFIHADFIENKHILENGDLCIIKDVLQHLCNKDINDLLSYLVEYKKYKYILICNCCNQKNNNDNINNGEWRPLSALKQPLSIFKPQILFTYNTKEVSIITT